MKCHRAETKFLSCPSPAVLPAPSPEAPAASPCVCGRASLHQCPAYPEVCVYGVCTHTVLANRHLAFSLCSRFCHSCCLSVNMYVCEHTHTLTLTLVNSI